jgi:hypothetical protein
MTAAAFLRTRSTSMTLNHRLGRLRQGRSRALTRTSVLKFYRCSTP